MCDYKISIIVPVYNNEEYISICLDSLVNQTYRNLEIICVNDGSKDNSLSYIEQYAKEDQRVILLNKENEGVSLARNAGLCRSTGEYIMFVDGDDWIELTACETALSEITSNDYDVLMWPYIREKEKTSMEKKIFSVDRIFFGREEINVLQRKFIGPYGSEVYSPENMDSLCTVWGKLYKSSVIKDNKIVFEDIRKIGSFEDGLFNLFCFQHVKSAKYINKYLYHYRKNNQRSITKTHNDSLRKQRTILYTIMNEYIDENVLDKTFKTALENRICIDVLGLGLNAISTPGTCSNKIKGIKEILNDTQRRQALKEFDISGFPIHWKLFYQAARKENTIVLFFLLSAIRFIRRLK